MLAMITPQAQINLEKALGKDVGIVVSVNHVENFFSELEKTVLFEVFSEIHRMKHNRSFRGDLAKFAQHPLYKLIKEKIVVGFVPPKDKGKQAKYIIIGKGENTTSLIQMIYQEEEKKGKLYKLPEQKYQGHKILCALHPKNGKLEKRYVLLTPSLYFVSNELTRIKNAYDRWIGIRKDSILLPQIYKQAAPKALINIHINVQKFHIDFSKKNPLEKRFPAMAKFFHHIRQAVQNTESLNAHVIIEKGLFLRIFRKRKKGTTCMLPEMELPKALLTNRTVLFTALPIPYSLLWYGIKSDQLRKNPRGWRKMESKLTEFFDYADIEDEIIPQIGPHTALLLELPQSPQRQISGLIPEVTLAIVLGPKVRLIKALDKLWNLASRNPKVSKHIKREVHHINSQKIVHFYPTGTPIDNIIRLNYSLHKNLFFISTHMRALKRVSNIKSSPIKKFSLYTYINFQNLVQLLQANHAIFKKHAAKKGRPFSQKKWNTGIKVFRSLENLTLFWEDQDGVEALEFALRLK